jgi:LPXTG-motif cell wall-anchored protein
VKAVFIPIVLLLALNIPASAGNNPGQQGQQGQQGGGGVRGAAGPLVGAGLPVLLIGGGIYWIVRRKKAS